METDMALKSDSQIYAHFWRGDWQIGWRCLGIWEVSVWYLSLYVRIH